MQVVQDRGARQILQDDDLMPLLEQEYNSLSRPLSRTSTPLSCNLASISTRATQRTPAQAFTWQVSRPLATSTRYKWNPFAHMMCITKPLSS